MKQDITELFCMLDDFMKVYEEVIKTPLRKATRIPGLALSEMMTIILLFHQSPCKNFKYFYLSYLQLYKGEFPGLLSYSRFIYLMPRTFMPFNVLMSVLFGQKTGTYFIDSTGLKVCCSKRTHSHKVFKGLATLGKTTKGWLMGFKLHGVINQKGEFMKLAVTQGHVHDLTPLGFLSKGLVGKLFGDKAYLSQEVFESLYAKGIKLITGLRKNMSNKLMLLHEKYLLRARNIIETVFDYLKNKFQLEHTRHRSPQNAFVHIISTVVAYSLKKSKPAIKDRFLIN